MRTSSFEGHRQERYFIKLLDKNDQELGILDSTNSGTLSFDSEAPINGGGNITITNGGDVNWESVRIQPWFEIVGFDSWPLGVFIPTKPGDNYSSESVKITLDLHDKLIILDEDKLPSYSSVPKGANVVNTIKTYIESSGQTRVSITPSSATTKEMLVWEAGTPKLNVINDLLKFINYRPLFVDEWGVFQVMPYVAPSALPIRRTFQKGAEAIHSPIWDRTRDIASIPNRVVLIADGSSEFEGIVGTAEITDPKSPYSFESRGRWVVHTETGIEAESPGVINELAQRRLVELLAPQTTIDITHAVVPIMLGDVIRFITDNDHGDVDVLATVSKLQYTLTPGSLCQATWKEVPVT